MPVLRNTTARYWSRPAGVNSPPTAAGAGAVTVKSPLLAAALIAARPAVVTGSVVLVTTSTLAGAAAAAFGLADAVAGATRARLNRARPRSLLRMLLLLRCERPREKRSMASRSHSLASPSRLARR